MTVKVLKYKVQSKRKTAAAQGNLRVLTASASGQHQVATYPLPPAADLYRHERFVFTNNGTCAEICWKAGRLLLLRETSPPVPLCIYRPSMFPEVCTSSTACLHESVGVRGGENSTHYSGICVRTSDALALGASQARFWLLARRAGRVHRFAWQQNNKYGNKTGTYFKYIAINEREMKANIERSTR